MAADAATGFPDESVRTNVTVIDAPCLNLAPDVGVSLLIPYSITTCLVTDCAAAYVLSPACDAITVHTPTAVNISSPPVMWQGPLAVYLTGSPELAVAVRLTEAPRTDHVRAERLVERDRL